MMWLPTPVILALQKQRQENGLKFKAVLGNIGPTGLPSPQNKAASNDKVGFGL